MIHLIRQIPSIGYIARSALLGVVGVLIFCAGLFMGYRQVIVFGLVVFAISIALLTKRL